MRSSLLISLSALLLFLPDARAQLAPAEDFFNRGAQAYISNNIPAALSQVETGLKLYPDDDPLKKLEQLLKQQQKQNQQQQQNQKNQNQKNQSQPQKSSGQKNQQNQNQPPQPDQKNQADQKKDDKQNQPKPKPADEKKNGEKPPAEKSGDKKDEPNAQNQTAQPEQMTPAEAKRLLDEQKGSEQILQMKPKGKPPDALHPVKDW